jgi:2-polyprenyl-3-methyl-5-hydroxy-6-metoxy-1,4-benzoquinol methylase
MSDNQARATQHWDNMHDQAIRSAWTENPVIARHLMRRITGTDKFWLNWLFEDYLPEHFPGRTGRILSIGCGDGAHELLIARHGYAGQIDAFDASPKGIAKAQSQAEAENLKGVDFWVDSFENFASMPHEPRYDLVLFAGSMHHVRDIEDMLRAVRAILKSDGLLVFNEYIGSCYNIYPPAQVSIVNQVLSALHPSFIAEGFSRFVNPSIDSALAHDPSEAVRAPLIMQIVAAYFDFHYKRGFGGALLHPLFTCLNARKLNDGSPESETISSLLAEMDSLLAEHRVLPHDFCFAVCCQKET